MDIADILTDALRDAVLITGMVVIMMMLIESLNISSGGRFFSRLRGTRFGQIVLSALLGWIPGCMGGFASVSLFTHGMISFGALVAMLIATMGDESYVMLTLFPDKALLLSAVCLVSGILAGVIIDYLGPKLGLKPYIIKACNHMELHEEDRHHNHEEAPQARRKRSLTWKRAIILAGIVLYISALVTGLLGHDYDSAETPVKHGFKLLNEDWINVLFAGLSVTMLVIASIGTNHFVEDHLWNHVIARHAAKIFAWSFGVLILLGFITEVFDISAWINSNTPLMIVLATLIGIIPESGPHLIFVTLFASGVVPFPVLIASSISQDGHASLPLLAESRGAFLRAKAINCTVALIIGFSAMMI